MVRILPSGNLLWYSELLTKKNKFYFGKSCKWQSGAEEHKEWAKYILKQAAIDYVNSFKDTHKVELLPSHRLKIPGWEWPE
ncbi:MAG: hypothetical protein GY940_10815 [bacterium]|nr:hypothetical protein [bacterium]